MHRIFASTRELLLCGFMLSFLMACVDTMTVMEAPTPRTVPENRFITHANSTVMDTQTNLVWMSQDFQNLEGRAPETWLEVNAWILKINQQRYGGFEDWRLPTVAECKAIYHATPLQRSYRGKALGSPAAFAERSGEWYWTSDVQVWGSSHPHDVLTFNFRNGRTNSRYVGHRNRDEQSFGEGSVRLVRHGS